MDGAFEEKIVSDDIQKLNDLKHWLFEEHIRLEVRKKEIDDLYNKFMTERVQFVEEMKTINLRVVKERQRLKDEEEFFDKKMEILKNGFDALEADKRQLAKDRKVFEMEKKSYRMNNSDNVIRYSTVEGNLFAGVNNPLALKKRYRDLLKIFHPDNMCGDNEMVAIITKQYDAIRKEMDYPFKSVK